VVILGIKPTSDDDDINRLVYIQTGNLSEQAVQHIYQHARIIIFPSLYEGFGFPTLEAASYSKPLVLFNSDVNHEIVDAFNLQDNTFFFNTFRELPSILTEINSLDRTHASRISRTWSDVARETFSFIEAVLSVPVDLKNLTDRYTHITNLELHDTQW
jgi:glycosyltransferase involved in cell wall biosynthesis